MKPLSSALLFLTFSLAALAEKKPSVLFIMVDDLRDWTGYSTDSSDVSVHTPNLDALAEGGTVFTSAHCAAPVCLPSRTALLTGLSPATTGVYTNSEQWPVELRTALTLTQHFMQSDYRVIGYGKIYHGQGKGPYWHDFDYGAYSPAPLSPVRPEALGHRLEMDDSETGDGMRVDQAIKAIQTHKEGPLFLACGLVRPHTPWDAPSKYFDLYPLDDLPDPPSWPGDLEDIPPIGKLMASRPHTNRYHQRNDSWSYEDIVEAGLWKTNLQAYLACISFADAQVGRLIQAWKSSPLSENGIIILVGDHGWHHGEKDHWSKRTLWEVGTRTPFILHAPGISQPGDVVNVPVSLLDIYPTLIDLCNLSERQDLDGVSLSPWLKQNDAPRLEPAVTLYGKDNVALRLQHWRYIRYSDQSEELYDHRVDPEELNNLAKRAGYESTLEDFRNLLPISSDFAPTKNNRTSWFEDMGLR